MPPETQAAIDPLGVLSYLMIGSVVIWAAACLVTEWRAAALEETRKKPRPEIHLEWIPGIGHKPFHYPMDHEERIFLEQWGDEMFRNRKRENPMLIDTQCARCFKIIDGPDRGMNPGYEIMIGPSGAPVSHTLCPECQAETYVPTMEALYGPDWEEKAREAKRRLDEEKERDGN